MAQKDAWRAYYELALGMTETSRKKAQRIAERVAGKGGATAEQLQTLAEDLVNAGLANREAMSRMVRMEIDRALGRVGLATMDEVEELTKRVQELERDLRAASGAPAVKAEIVADAVGGVEKKAVQKAVAKKTVAKKAVATKAVAKKAVATKAAANKTVAKTAPKSTAAPKTAAAPKSAAPKATSAVAEPAATEPAGAKPAAAAKSVRSAPASRSGPVRKTGARVGPVRKLGAAKAPAQRTAATDANTTAADKGADS